jgi:protein-arginine kinase activator protein McsA
MNYCQACHRRDRPLQLVDTLRLKNVYVCSECLHKEPDQQLLHEKEELLPSNLDDRIS